MINGSYWIARHLAQADYHFARSQSFPIALAGDLRFAIVHPRLIVIFFVADPESPRWLMIHGRNAEAEAIGRSRAQDMYRIRRMCRE